MSSPQTSTAEKRFAIVTGTSSGLGLAIARRLLDDGWKVVGISRRPGLVDHEHYEHDQLDLSDLTNLRRHFEGPFLTVHNLARFQRIAIVNNAGRLGPVASLPHTDPSDLAASIAVNAVAPAYLMGFACQHARHAKLRIVNVSSGAATKAYPGWTAYCVGKAALRMAGEVLAVEAGEVAALRKLDLAVMSYAPNVVDTPMQGEVRSSDPDEFPRLQRFLDLERDKQLVDPARPAAHLAGLLLRDDLPVHSELRFEP